MHSVELSTARQKSGVRKPFCRAPQNAKFLIVQELRKEGNASAKTALRGVGCDILRATNSILRR